MATKQQVDEIACEVTANWDVVLEAQAKVDEGVSDAEARVLLENLMALKTRLAELDERIAGMS